MADEKRNLEAPVGHPAVGNSQVDTAPPAYREPQQASQEGISELSTFDGKITASHVFEVVRVPQMHVGDRKLAFKAPGSAEDTFVAMMEAVAPGIEIRKIMLHWQDEQGDIAGIATIPAMDDVPGVVTVGDRKTKVVAHKTGVPKFRWKGKVAAKYGDVGPPKQWFEVGDLTWRASDRFLHSDKGKSRAGDLELTDRNGNVVAAFLNTWDGNPVATELGKLYLVSAGNDATMALPILSGLVVLLHLSYRERDDAKAVLKHVSEGVGTYICAVM